MPPKRPSQEAFPHEAADEIDMLHDPARSKMKLPRNPANDVNSDFSAQVKNRLSQYSRTGQACDRCKVRKIKCDALPDGCSHCIQQNLDCFVTDRVTGRTEKRGYMRELERKKQQMESHIRALEKMLGDNGIEVKPWTQSSSNSAMTSLENGHCESMQDRDAQDWTHANGNESPLGSDAYKPQRFTRPKLETRPADRHLGVSTDRKTMSSINGTRLSILGATVDITDFDGEDMEEPSPTLNPSPRMSRPVYNKSVHSLWQSIHGVNPTPNIQLPPRAEGLQYAEWYFRIMSPFLPVLHKPTIVKLLTRIYDDNTFQPSAPELAIAHMVMAFIFWQKAVRNQGQISSHEDNKRSNLHYHFALSKFNDLLACKSVAGVQAMGLIAVHCRSFPKPGCSSIVAHQALRYAIDLDLHRAVKRPAGTTNLQNEMRKRVFWTALAILVTVDGRLGRPMPITVDEYDVDFPEAIADELLTDDDINTSQKGHCTYHPGIAAFRIVPLMIEMYSNIYSVRRDPGNYSSVIKHLEQQLQLWREELPESYRSRSAEFPQSEIQIHPLYVQVMELDYRLSLRHPSVAVQSDQELCAENSRICEETAAELLKVYKILSDINALDTTWYSVSVYVAAMFSTLVAHWERRFIMTPAQIKKLESDMKDWLKVISSGASLFGSSSQIRSKLQVIVERTIRSIEQDSTQKISRSAPPTAESTPPVKREAGATPASQSVPIGYAGGTTASSLPPDASTNGNTGSGNLGHMAKAYYSSSAAQQAYPAMAYAATAFDSGSGYMYSQTNAASAPPVVSGAVETNPLIEFASQAEQHVVEPPGSDQYYWRQTQGTNWQEWAAAMASNQDQYGANALMTMGRDLHTPTTMPPDMATQQWPMLLWGGHEQPGA